MIKGLEIVNGYIVRLEECLPYTNEEGVKKLKLALKEFYTIEKELQALYIIKEYQVDMWLLNQCDYENYIRIRKEAMVSIGEVVNENGEVFEDEIPQEEFEFVKKYFEQVE